MQAARSSAIRKTRASGPHVQTNRKNAPSKLQPTRDPHRTHRFSVSALQRRNERSHQYMPHAGLAQTEERGGKSSQETDKTAREADNRGDDPCNAVLCRHVVVTCRAHRKHCARSNKVKVSVKVATNSPGRKKVATTRTGLTLLLVLLARRHVHHGCRLRGRVPRPSADTSYAPAPTDRANATHGADTLRLSKVLLLLPLRWRSLRGPVLWGAVRRGVRLSLLSWTRGRVPWWRVCRLRLGWWTHVAGWRSLLVAHVDDRGGKRGGGERDKKGNGTNARGFKRKREKGRGAYAKALLDRQTVAPKTGSGREQCCEN